MLAMLVAIALTWAAIGEAVRRAETARLTESLEKQSGAIVSLLTGLTTEAIIVEDVPLVETALAEAVARISQLKTIQVWNEDHELIAQAGPALTSDAEGFSRFEQDVEFEGEVFGSISVFWSTREGIIAIEESVFQARFFSALALIMLTLLFLGLIGLLVLKPLQVVHSEMEFSMARKARERRFLPGHAALEFKSLQDSVTKLEEVLAEREQREEALLVARQKADASSKAKSEFLANMSHEIRTPMNGVIGMAELILETRLTKTQRSYAETISQSGAALLTIINDILDFSKIEAGKAELNPEPFDLLQSIEDVASLVASKAAEQSIEVVLRYQPAFPTCFVGDAGRIRQVITNIVGNAVKFTRQGHVKVSVSGETTDGTAHIRIDVSDTGIGIAKDKLKSVFSAFEQADGTTNRQFGGTGLGLAISNNLIAMMGGSIEARSEPGKGSVFTIMLSLPVTSDVIPESKNEIGVLAGKRALIVDDLKINRKILFERLRHWLMEPVIASSGAEAVEIIASASADTPFDVVLMDFNMPGMDGMETTQAIRDLPGGKTLPVLLLTSVDQGVDMRTRKSLSIADVLIKPVRSTLLSDTLILCTLNGAADKSRGKSGNVPNVGAKKAPSRDLSKVKLLIAEDNATNRKVLEMMLRKSGVEIRFALNGREAWEQFQNFDPSMVFMDVSMPEMDGLEATRKIRQTEEAKGLARMNIVALTANARSDDRERCLAAGMDDFLSKLN